MSFEFEVAGEWYLPGDVLKTALWWQETLTGWQIVNAQGKIIVDGKTRSECAAKLMNLSHDAA